MSTLSAVLDRVSRTRHPVVVFDLDSTLFRTTRRNLRILTGFAEEHAHLHPRLVEVATSLQPGDVAWHVQTTLRRRGITDPAVLEAQHRYWQDRFFTPEYVLFDEPTPGAAPFVRACHGAGALVYYLTGRSRRDLGEVTVTKLLRHGFPCLEGRVVLHLRPHQQLDEHRYKLEAHAEIRSLGGEVVATFENDPDHANALLESFPAASHFLVGDDHDPAADPPGSGVVAIPDLRLA